MRIHHTTFQTWIPNKSDNWLPQYEKHCINIRIFVRKMYFFPTSEQCWPVFCCLFPFKSFQCFKRTFWFVVSYVSLVVFWWIKTCHQVTWHVIISTNEISIPNTYLNLFFFNFWPFIFVHSRILSLLNFVCKRTWGPGAISAPSSVPFWLAMFDRCDSS